MTEIVAKRDAFEQLAQAWASEQGQELWNKIIPTAQGEPPPESALRLESFSDSFILTFWSDEPAPRQVNRLGNDLIAMFLYGIDQGMLFRGAMAYGPFCQGTRSLVGPAVDEAYEWSGLASWAGILCAPSARKAIDDAIPEAERRALQGDWARWPVPLADRSTFDTWVLWWPRTGKRNAVSDLFLVPPTPRDVETKMSNTLKFYDWAVGLFKVGVKDEP